MLSRPEIGTSEHVLLWLDRKDPNESYEWNSGKCPAGLYSEEFGDTHTGLNLDRLNNLAWHQPHTWGALHERAEKAWVG